MLNIISLSIVYGIVLTIGTCMFKFAPTYLYLLQILGGLLFVPGYIFQMKLIIKQQSTDGISYMYSLLANVAMILMQIFATVELVNGNKSMLAFCATNGVLTIFSFIVLFFFYYYKPTKMCI